jgi:glycerate dehydrogenase
MQDRLPRVVALEAESIRAEVRRPQAPHDWIGYPATNPEQVLSRLEGAAVVIVNKVQLDAALLAQLPDLRMISVSATGTDNVDLAACRERGIVVCNVRDYAADTVPEHALMLMMALRRNLLGYVADVRAGLWAKSPVFCLFDRPVGDLNGATLAIVGRGTLGDGLARRAEALGMRVIYAERHTAAAVREGYVAFGDAIGEADVVSLHCPLNAETRGLMNAEVFAQMKSSAVLVNTARGGLVDEAALADALRSGRIAGAATDVLTQEPPREPNPLLAPDVPNLIVTPHMAWASAGAMQRLADSAIANVDAFLRGAPVNRVA